MVTGASSGIGAAYAEALAEAGYDLAVVARRRDRLQALAGALHDRHGARVDVVTTDLADPAQVTSLAERLAGERVDLLVSSAGFAGYKPFVGQDPTDVPPATVAL